MPVCAFWRQTRSRIEAAGIPRKDACSIAETGLASLRRVWRAGRTDPAILRRAKVTRELATAIAATAGKPHLLDSSKTPGHALLLLRHLPEARVIYLVREPRALLKSYVWRVHSGKHVNRRFRGLAERSTPLYLATMVARWIAVNLICGLM
jgi:Sulfotransferase family